MDDTWPMAMNKAELRKYRTALKAKHAELAGGLMKRDGMAIEKTADALDAVQLAGERELAISTLDRESNLLRNVRAALTRMAEGCYGTCLYCEQEIGSRRLAAVPWTAYCLKCQQAADRRELITRRTSSLVTGH